MNMNKTNEDAPLLTTTELAAKLNVSRITVLRMAKDKRIPYIAISATEFRYNYNEVIAKLKSA